ncbi:MAG: hypothetical protein KZQ76_11580, partial [Candidatus Thiodiazotropha sp. (ex Epidulcina cf. delphinae)]|nr:hypothetical protein [Candidatus Thiodiazotropha sp. (ex Epidulcina cf. delphinae)]
SRMCRSEAANNLARKFYGLINIGCLWTDTNYNPNEHWLAALSKMVVKEDSSFDSVFPQETEEEKSRFLLLDYAYIGARYDPKYRISKEGLGIIAVSVKKLLKLTEKICRQKIKDFTD